MLREAIEQQGIAGVVEAPGATDDDLLLAHDPRYLERVVTGRLSDREVKAVGLPWSPELVERGRRSVGATIAAARTALDDGVGINLGGGTHHAFAGSGKGFCTFNDVVVATRRLRTDGAIARVLVVDLDVHQGDGTHSMLGPDPDATCLSINGGANYPFRRVPGDVEEDLPDGTGDDAYLATLERLLPSALDRGRPDICFYLAGADPYEDDRLGRLALTVDGLAARDAMVRDCMGLLGVPVVVLLAGGYGRRIEDTVAINLATVSSFAR
ncbi:MAG: histone deacetylase [Thermoleophilia bacterium]|nr:histone deacetylase [Thermoleophilia bacterium]